MTPSETPSRSASDKATQPPLWRWGWPAWERDEVLREQVALLRHNFPMTLAASLAGAFGTLWIMLRVADMQALSIWAASHLLVVTAVYLGLRSIAPWTDPAIRSACKLMAGMAAMGLSWGSLAYTVLYWGKPDSVVYAIGIITTVCAGALGLGAPLYRAYVIYLTGAMVGVWTAIVVSDLPVMWPALLLTFLYYVLTCLQARTADSATKRSIALKLENENLLVALRAQTDTAVAAQKAAERADRDKSRFLAAASHDLRQPLHALGLFLESLQRSSLDAHQHAITKHARAASGAAAEMMTTLLDYSRLEAGVVKVAPVAFAIQPLLTALEQEFGGQADSAGLVYRTRETCAAAYADKSLVGLVMHNLISNALRYTRRGGVLIACRTHGNRLALEVWDTGIGIPRHQWDDIFNEFYQLGNPERDRRNGLGLGLAIVRRLAHEMEAAVDLRSEPGKGSVFRLWIEPWHGTVEEEVAPAAQGSELDVSALQGVRVLAVDDDETVRLGLCTLLESWGCVCTTAASGAEALLCVQGWVPDIIITDFRLRREETGKDVLQALRNHVGVAVPAIIVTGDTSPQRLRDAQSTSALLLHKPVSTRQLRDAMVQLVSPAVAHSVESGVITSGAASP